jgi:predicted RNase H-like HicB family nuclease
MEHYHINLFYSTEDEGYIADIPDLPKCSAFGATPMDALRELQTAKELWLETYKKRGNAIPRAHYRPFIYQVPAHD